MRIHRLLLMVALVCGVASLSARVAQSTGIPTFNYLYTCSSEVINCADFPTHHDGTYVSNGLPVGGSYYNGIFMPYYVNNLGEAVGYIYSPCPIFECGGPVAGYGDASGQAYDFNAEDSTVQDINDNGVYLADFPGNGDGSICFGAPGGGGGCQNLTDAAAPYASFFSSGINDLNQVLAEEGGGPYDSAQVVLSPTPAPESSSLILFCAALLGLITLSYFKSRSL